MYFYPEDIKEIALAVRVEAAKQHEPAEFDKMIEWARALESIAASAETHYGRRATVSVDESAVRGYAIPMSRGDWVGNG